MQNDVLRSLDMQNDVILVLLDLSAAFDTINHNILLHRLRCRFQIIGTVRVGSMVSNALPLNCGVPQGSVLGPVLLCLYTAPLEDIILRNGLNYMMYADDTQLYMTCTRDHVPITKIEQCIEEIRQWMRVNMLALNDSKTEVIRFSSKFGRRGPPRACSVQVGEVSVHSLTEVRDLGVMLDASGTMSAHVTKLCKSASYALWRIGKIRNLLDRNSTEKLFHAFVTSKFDYCNSLLFGLPEFELRKLQVIQNSAARLVTRIKIFEHITPVLKSLHWLPVNKRLEVKVLCLVYKILKGIAPGYLCELLSVKSTTCTLRSTFSGAVCVQQPLGKTKYCGDRSFTIFAPCLWNGLPATIRSADTIEIFKTSLKTHLLRITFLSLNC